MCKGVYVCVCINVSTVCVQLEDEEARRQEKEEARLRAEEEERLATLAKIRELVSTK